MTVACCMLIDVESTMDEAWNALNLLEKTNLPWGLWVVANDQSAGRGQYNRVWESGTGNFFGSWLINENKLSHWPAAGVTLGLGLAVRIWLLNKMNLRQVDIKWPNDVLINGKKIAGILTQKKGQYLVVGLGLNTQTTPCSEAIGLQELDKISPMNTLLAQEISIIMAGLLKKEFSSVCRQLESLPMLPLGEKIMIEGNKGQCMGLSPEGGLMVDCDGIKKVIYEREAYTDCC